MAEPLPYRPLPSQPPRDPAWEELDALVQTLHTHGVLRLARTAVAAAPELAAITTDTVNHSRGIDILRNLAQAADGVGRLDPQDIARTFAGAGAALAALNDPATPQPRSGLRGTFDLLRDEQLWRAAGPLLGAVKAFSAASRQPAGETTTATPPTNADSVPGA